VCPSHTTHTGAVTASVRRTVGAAHLPNGSVPLCYSTSHKHTRHIGCN